MNTAPEKIDLTGIVRGILRACRHLLLWGIILCLVLGAALGFYSYRSYTPLYTASVSFTVQTTNPHYSSQQYYNASTAEQLAKTFPYILTSGVLLQQVQQELQISSMPSLSASVLGSTNIFTLSSTSTIANPNSSNSDNVISEGSLSRMRSVLLISFGITILPRSSIRLTIPVAFILHPPK